MSSPITGFTAIPNPQMLAFMPIQSYLMMYFAGAGWQIGKRKMSAIPNTEFNKMSINDLLKGFTADLRETIPTLIKSMNDVTPLIEVLIKQYGDFVKEAIAALPQAAQTVAGALVNPKGALVPPLFGPELEKVVTGSPTQAQFLAYAKIFMQQMIDAGRIKLIPVKASTQTIKPFQGPEINPVTGEQSTFIKNVQDLPPPAPHIKPRPVSNVSLQSLRLTLADLQFQVRRAGTNYKNALAQFNLSQRWSAQEKARNSHKIRAFQQKVGQTIQALRSAQQKLANFLKMHGSRL